MSTSRVCGQHAEAKGHHLMLLPCCCLCCYPFDLAQDMHASPAHTGLITPHDAVERVLDFLERHNGRCHWLSAYDAADVRAQAAASTERRAAGKPLSVLDGVPFVVKDCIDAMPYPTSSGTKFLGVRCAAHSPPVYSQPSVPHPQQYSFGARTRIHTPSHPLTCRVACLGSWLASACVCIQLLQLMSLCLLSSTHAGRHATSAPHPTCSPHCSRPATADAPCVAALKSLGAVLLGKGSMCELGAFPYGRNAHAGATVGGGHPVPADMA